MWEKDGLPAHLTGLLSGLTECICAQALAGSSVHRKGVLRCACRPVSSLPLSLLLENAAEHLGAACVFEQARSLSLLIYLLESEEGGSSGGS